MFLIKKLAINYDNGKAIIDIESNNIQGIPHNDYSDFNVDERGLVFNNFKGQYITIIVNKVTPKIK